METTGRELTVINIEEYAMTADRVVGQVQLIHEIMNRTMVKNEHYGTIPGTKKPSLYKPGAEKLSVTFRLVPKYEIEKTDLPNGHREYQVICTLIHAPTGQFFGQGVGSCSTMEGKYRFRNAEPEITDKRVPRDYWDLSKANSPLAQAKLGGKGFVAKKTENGWFIAKLSGERVEHDNPADYYNTALKMAKKRSHVDAVLTATAASDIFTQDVEDMTQEATVSPPEEVIPGQEEQQGDSQKKGRGPAKNMSEAQRKKLWAMMAEKKLSREESKALYDWVNPKSFQEASDFIDQFDNALEGFRNRSQEPADEGGKGEENPTGEPAGTLYGVDEPPSGMSRQEKLEAKIQEVLEGLQKNDNGFIHTAIFTRTVRHYASHIPEKMFRDIMQGQDSSDVHEKHREAVIRALVTAWYEEGKP